MTSTIACTNGVGLQTGTLFAYDRAASVILSGLAMAYNHKALTAMVSTRDGRTHLATATATQVAGAAAFLFDLDTADCRALFQAGAERTIGLRFRAWVKATDEVVADALVTMTPGARAGVTP